MRWLEWAIKKDETRREQKINKIVNRLREIEELIAILRQERKKLFKERRDLTGY